MTPTPVSSEERFYSHYAATVPRSADVSTAAEFAPGARYHICRQSLDAHRGAAGGTLVELGCGDGRRLLHLRDRYGFARAVGVDLGLAAPVEHDSAHFLPANLNDTWPLADGEVDVLVAMMLFEHLFDPFFCFRELARVLAPEGRAFVNLPLITSLKNRLRLLVGCLPITSVPYARWAEEGHWDGFHLHYFTLASIRDLAAHAGLSMVSVQAVGAATGLKQRFPTLLCDEISFELRHARTA